MKNLKTILVSLILAVWSINIVATNPEINELNTSVYDLNTRLEQIETLLPFAEEEQKSQLLEEKNSIEAMVFQLKEAEEEITSQLKDVEAAKDSATYWTSVSVAAQEKYDKLKEKMRNIRKKTYITVGIGVGVFVIFTGTSIYLLKDAWAKQAAAEEKLRKTITNLNTALENKNEAIEQKDEAVKLKNETLILKQETENLLKEKNTELTNLKNQINKAKTDDDKEKIIENESLNQANEKIRNQDAILNDIKDAYSNYQTAENNKWSFKKKKKDDKNKKTTKKEALNSLLDIIKNIQMDTKEKK